MNFDKEQASNWQDIPQDKKAQECMNLNVTENFATGGCNDDVKLLLETGCQLIIANIWFKHKDAHKHSWMCPRWMDFIKTHQRSLHNFPDTRAAGGAICSTGHIMIRSTTGLKIRKQLKKKGQSCQPVMKPKILKLKNVRIRIELDATLNEQLLQLDGTLAQKWTFFRDTVYKASPEKLSSVTRKHED